MVLGEVRDLIYLGKLNTINEICPFPVRGKEIGGEGCFGLGAYFMKYRAPRTMPRMPQAKPSEIWAVPWLERPFFRL